MTECWWPCCSDSYNIRRYDTTGAVVWSQTLAGGNTITHVDVDDTTMYIASNNPVGQYLYSYDISGATPSENWSATGSLPVIGAYSTGASDIKAIPASLGGGVLVLTQNNYNAFLHKLPPAHITEYGVSGYYLLKYNTSGTLVWRRKIGYPNTKAAIAYVEAGQQNARGKSITLDSSGVIYVGTQYGYTTHGYPGTWSPTTFPAGRPCNILKLASDSSFLDAFTGLTPAEITTLGNNVGLAPAFSVVTDSSNVYWCTIGKYSGWPSGVTVVGAVSCSSGSYPWTGPTQNVSKDFGWHQLQLYSNDLYLAAGRGPYSVPSGYTAAPFRAWYAATGVHSHDASIVTLCDPFSMAPDAPAGATLAAVVDDPAKGEYALASAPGTLEHSLVFGSAGDLPKAAYSFSSLIDSHILAGPVVSV